MAACQTKSEPQLTNLLKPSSCHACSPSRSVLAAAAVHELRLLASSGRQAWARWHCVARAGCSGCLERAHPLRMSCTLTRALQHDGCNAPCQLPGTCIMGTCFLVSLGPRSYNLPRPCVQRPSATRHSPPAPAVRTASLRWLAVGRASSTVTDGRCVDQHALASAAELCAPPWLMGKKVGCNTR